MFNSSPPNVARECWKVLVKDTVRRTLYDESGVIKKSPFPYEACSNDEYLTVDRDSLPPMEYYYSLLKQCNVKQKDYEYADQIYKRYGMKNLEEFNEFYNVMDVLITSVFIGESSKKLYDETDIEIRRCSSMSQFTGMAMLLKSRETPQLPNSFMMYELATSGIRAGLSTIGKRYAINTAALSEEKFLQMCKVEDGEGEQQYYASTIWKVDEKNQYGGSQDCKMPYIGFVERKNPSVEMVKALLKKIDAETDNQNGYGFFATVSMSLHNQYHDDSILYSPMIVKTAPELQWMSSLQLRYYADPMKNGK